MTNYPKPLYSLDIIEITIQDITKYEEILKREIPRNTSVRINEKNGSKRTESRDLLVQK